MPRHCHSKRSGRSARAPISQPFKRVENRRKSPALARALLPAASIHLGLKSSNGRGSSRRSRRAKGPSPSAMPKDLRLRGQRLSHPESRGARDLAGLHIVMTTPSPIPPPPHLRLPPGEHRDVPIIYVVPREPHGLAKADIVAALERRAAREERRQRCARRPLRQQGSPVNTKLVAIFHAMKRLIRNTALSRCSGLAATA